MKRVVLSAAAALLAGCASGGHCVGEFDYQKAQNLPAAAPADGVKVADTGSTLRIPPEPSQKTAYAEKYPDPEKPGKEKIRCLDAPPSMEEPAAPPAAPETPKKP